MFKAHYSLVTTHILQPWRLLCVELICTFSFSAPHYHDQYFHLIFRRNSIQSLNIAVVVSSNKYFKTSIDIMSIHRLNPRDAIGCVSNSYSRAYFLLGFNWELLE